MLRSMLNPGLILLILMPSQISASYVVPHKITTAPRSSSTSIFKAKANEVNTVL